MNPLRLSRVAMSSSMASVYDILSTIRSFFRASGQLPSFIADRPIADVKSILDTAAEKHSAGCVIAYPKGDVADMVSGRRLSYKELHDQAQSNAALLRQTLNFKKSRLVLLHFGDHLENIVWFWSVLYADCTPVMSTPFTDNIEQRQKHIQHLHTLLEDPLCVTSSASLGDFSGQDILKPIIVEDLLPKSSREKPHRYVSTNAVTDPAILMLTSGSSGNAKAVCLSHKQIFAAIKGKASVVKLDTRTAFLNWVGLDHVAGLIEIHLQAMHLGMDQVHVPAATVIADPSSFLNIVSRHRVSRSFAPNFYLAKLKQTIESNDPRIDKNLDLSCLSYLASGGESNHTGMCSAVSNLLHHKYGAPENVIIPGFGMTETCAGAIFNKDFPFYDIRDGLEFASLGKCMPGIHMRVTQPGSATVVLPDEAGNLEISGSVVFTRYYNNPSATDDAFTADGWFKTGDRAIIDSAGYLKLIGRSKEVININGVKHLPHELETAIDEASIVGATSSYTVCLSHRPKDSTTERIHLFYLPTYLPEDSKARVETLDAIVSAVMLQTRTRPYVLPLDGQALQKTTLGKISRAKIKTAFERGDYTMYQRINNESIKSYRERQSLARAAPSSEWERLLVRELCEVLDLDVEDMDIDNPIFSMGVTSVDLIRLKRNIEKQLSPAKDIPMITLLTNPTIRALAKSIESSDLPTEYNPVVKMQHQGVKTPLWLVHPGVGEVLVFINLAKHITDRPVYALRARGFSAGETSFESIQEAVMTYHAAIKETQPTGPYSIAGYSYGTMLAYETAKILEGNGNEVRFLGSFNLPPHIKDRMNQLVWSECLLHLSYFLDIVTETTASELSAPLHSLTKEQALVNVVKIANPTRMAELSLTSEALYNWANLAFALQGIAKEYEPTGTVASMDVFYATPLAAVAQSKKEWVEGPLSKWRDFVREAPRYHEVDGAHYTMISPEHVQRFAKTLKSALQARGL